MNWYMSYNYGIVWSGWKCICGYDTNSNTYYNEITTNTTTVYTKKRNND